jgi:hypothetical protein
MTGHAASIFTIVEGTSEIQRMFVVRAVTRLDPPGLLCFKPATKSLPERTRGSRTSLASMDGSETMP